MYTVRVMDPGNDEMKTAYPNLLSDRNITADRVLLCSVLTLTIGNNQGMGNGQHGTYRGFCFPPSYLRLFDGPSCSIIDVWRILGWFTTNGGLVFGTIIKPRL